MPMVASVTMIGGIPAKATNRPLAAPNAAPTTNPAAIASAGGMPAIIRPAIKVPESAITGPTDRSIPPVRIARLMPAAMMAMIEAWRARLIRLLVLRKLSLSRAMAANTSANPISAPVVFHRRSSTSNRR